MKNDNLTKALKIVLADTYALFLKTQNYHWNVEGPRFASLHNLFEEQYTELFEAADTIAEIIRQLGQKAPGTFKDFADLTNIEDGKDDADADTMLKDLGASHGTVMDSLYAAKEVAEEVNDEATLNAIGDRLEAHRKAKWMLESHLA